MGLYPRPSLPTPAGLSFLGFGPLRDPSTADCSAVDMSRTQCAGCPDRAVSSLPIAAFASLLETLASLLFRSPALTVQSVLTGAPHASMGTCDASRAASSVRPRENRALGRRRLSTPVRRSREGLPGTRGAGEVCDRLHSLRFAALSPRFADAATWVGPLRSGGRIGGIDSSLAPSAFRPVLAQVSWATIVEILADQGLGEFVRSGSCTVTLRSSGFASQPTVTLR